MKVSKIPTYLFANSDMEYFKNELYVLRVGGLIIVMQCWRYFVMKKRHFFVVLINESLFWLIFYPETFTITLYLFQETISFTTYI